eukprot:CAMPEP_0174734024 /NCGR_PEP_ID=MMETSP1094-20130205/62459_1 /TAXON_ID=156173 /ORGANISM="Chrysochromulina brevifilum, Strain UTEX LB 985" /LENGTH=84 /DNA_ID=CAMNT_0015936765 /DNA_START=260 /DNA_END=514 /DNA_ORIENTATION=+
MTSMQHDCARDPTGPWAKLEPYDLSGASADGSPTHAFIQRRGRSGAASNRSYSSRLMPPDASVSIARITLSTRTAEGSRPSLAY